MKYDPERDIHFLEGEQIFDTVSAVRADGTTRAQYTRLNGLLHAKSADEPSIAVFDENGNPNRQVWHAYGLEHRLNGPAEIIFHHGTDRPGTEIFMHEGKPRAPEEGPWCIVRNLDGSIKREEFAEPQAASPSATCKALEP